MSKVPTVNDVQRSELVAFETFLQNELSNLPNGINNLVKFPAVKKHISNFVEGIEDFIIPFMNEDNGLVDGIALHDVVKNVKPELLDYFEIPFLDFRLVDIARDLLQNAVNMVSNIMGLFGGNQ